MDFLFAFGSFFFPFGLLLLGAVVLAVLAIAGRRAAPDPTGRRPMAVYLLAVMFIALFATAGAVAQIGGTLADLVTEEPGVPLAPPPLPAPVPTFEGVEEIPYPESPAGEGGFLLAASPDPTLSRVLEAAFVGLLAAGIFEFHRRQWRVLLRKEGDDD